MDLAGNDDWWRAVDELFAAALEVPPENRAAFVDAACSRRPEFRRAVEDLLGLEQVATEWMERSEEAVREVAHEALAESDPSTAGAPPDESDEPPGSRIGQYRVIRKLARGGMGTVYLGERADGAFERKVALKVLRRGLDTDDILERFRRERQILAQLEHPHIARLLDGGATEDGRPYLVMEHVPGVPITEHCDRERLGVESRLRLFRTVCDAVKHAHDQGVVHRDLKPTNILVDASGRVKLLDFGIAKVLGAGPDSMRTVTGTRLMTPDYASPEQMLGAEVTAASDVYQLGLLMFEMLTGERAHRGRPDSAPEIDRRASDDSVEAPSQRVRSISGPGSSTNRIIEAMNTEPGRLRRLLRGDLDTIVLKAVRHEPERRYPSAADLAADVDRHLARLPIRARAPSTAYRVRRLVRRHRGRLLTATAAGGLVLGATALMPLLRSEPPVRPVRGTVAVLPFRTADADASLGYLREGMVDLLAAKLTGEGGPRAIPPTTVLEPWHAAMGSVEGDLPEAEALRLAGSLAAERLITGEVVGTLEKLVIRAVLLAVPGGEVEGHVSVEGTATALPSLVDDLVGRLLLLDAGEDVRSLPILADVSLPALRAYLAGEVAYRAARHDDAYDYFTQAVALDSSFALAAINAYQAAWLSTRSGDPNMLQVAWKGRDRLDALDRAYLDAALGPRYPEPYSHAERLAQRLRLLDLAPDRVESQYMVAGRLYHFHAFLNVADGRQRSVAHFRRALSLDSSYAPTYRHIVPLLYDMGETIEATRLARAYLRRHPSHGISTYLRWRMALAHDDTATMAEIRAGMETLPDLELLHMYRTSIVDSVSLEDADRAIELLRRRASSPSGHRRVLREHYIYQLLRGRPAAAVGVALRLGEAQALETGFPRLAWRNALVTTALYGDGDLEAGVNALEELTRGAFTSEGAPKTTAAVPDVCTVLQWKVWHGGKASERALHFLEVADRLGPTKDSGRVCSLLVRSIQASLEDHREADEHLARLDSALIAGPQAQFAEIVLPANLAAARLHEMRDDPERALSAIRRRVYNFDSAAFLLAVYLRREGRLAARTGDLEGAEHAYRHYLFLRTDPEPVLRPQLDSVRAELRAVRARRSALRLRGD